MSSIDILMGYSPDDLLGDRPTPLQTKSKNEYKRIGLQPIHKIKLWRLKPWYFFEEVLNMKLDKWQRQFVESFLANERTVAVASKGVGKTKLLAGCALYMLVLYHEPKIAVMSVTKDHLRDNLWAEIVKFIEKSPILKATLTHSATRIEVKGNPIPFIAARSIPKGANEEEMKSALAGLHANVVGFFVDEAGSLSDSLWDTADAILANENLDPHIPKFARILVCCNAEKPKGLFYRIYNSKRSGNPSAEAKQWEMINISSDPQDPNRAERVSKEWAQGVIDKYGGREHPVVKINILGVYPDTSEELLLAEWEIDEAMKRSYEDAHVNHMEPSIGVDVSRGGDDTIIAVRRGLKAFPFVKVDPSADGPAVGRAVKREAFARKAMKVKVDGTGGYGLSVIDYLKADGNLTVLSVIYNKTATKPDSFANIRTEMYVRLRDWVRNGGALPADPMLKEDLLAPKLNIRGSVFSLEPKEDIRKRLGRSPDRADALAQTFVDTDELTEAAAASGELDSLKYDENGNRRDVNEITLLVALKLREEQNRGYHISDDTQSNRMLHSNHLS